MDQQPMNMYYAGMQQQPQVAVRTQNALTAEEIEQLQKKGSHFSIAITNEERLRGICTHRLPDGSRDTLVEDPITGNQRCTICGYEFKPLDPGVSIEDIKDSVQVINNILQTIKILYIDLPPEAARDYFQIIPLIEKIPALFEFAAKDFSKHEINNWRMGSQPGTVNMFNNLMSLFGGGMPMGGAPYQQPMGGMGAPMPNQPMGMGMGAPMPNQQFGAAPVSNGFGYPGASQAVMPQYQAPTGFQYVPPQQTTPAAPTVNPAVAPTADAAAQAPATDTVKNAVKA